MRFYMPRRTSRHAPCEERACGHDSCDRLREIAKSPCTICRTVIGWEVWILDERSPQQQDRDILFSGFTHENCRRRWIKTFKPSQARRYAPAAAKKNATVPMEPPPIHINYASDRKKELPRGHS